MTPPRWIEFDPNVPLDPEELTNALDRIIESIAPHRGPVALVGPDALSCRLEPGWLRFDRLNVRTYENYHMQCPEFRLPLPDQMGDGLDVGVRFSLERMADGPSNSTRSTRPVASLANPATLDHPETLPLGRVDRGENGGWVLSEGFVRSERLDGCRAWASWRERADRLAAEIDDRCLALFAMAAGSGGSAPIWMAAAMPTIHELAAARRLLKPKDAPEPAVEAIENLAAAIEEWPSRMVRAGFPHVSAEEPTAVARGSRAGEALRGLERSARWIDRLSAALGLGLRDLPESLIRGDVVFRRVGVAARPAPSARSLQISTTRRKPMALAVLTRPGARPTRIGDIEVSFANHDAPETVYVMPDRAGVSWLSPRGWGITTTITVNEGVELLQAAHYES